MAQTQPVGKRIALAIGNAAYAHAPPLNNARADAGAIADKLKDVGFAEVTLLGDLGYEAMRRALQQFGRAAGDAEVAIVYYAGHAIELDGENHLIPVDAKLEQDRDVMFETVPLSQMLRAIDGPGALRLAILDACRDSPFPARMARANRTRAISRGLAEVEPQGNTLVAFSARGGTVALDGEGPHSPFAQALIDLMPTPGLELGFLFRQVRDAVLRATGRRQEPYLYGSLGADSIFLVPPDTKAKPPSDDLQAPDVFISYASGDRVQAEELARDLESEGYRVWWDTKLLSGQQYRKAIVSELEAARAAVVIWTASSVESDWVYDEANRARAAGKLIPVRAAELDPTAIQPPFGALHTILVSDRGGLRAALARHGVKPASAGSGSAASSAPAPSAAPVDDRTLEHGYWTAIQASDDPCDFETFLDKFPNGTYAPIARRRVESLLAGAKNVAAIDEFLRDHPQSGRAMFARKRKTELEWSELEKLGDAARLRDFIARQGEGAEVQKAKAALAKAEWRRLAASDEPEEIAKVLGDLRGFPEEALAAARLDSLRVEAAAWAAALAANDVPSFEKYLKQFPHGARAAEAKEKLNILDPSPPIFNRAQINVPKLKVPRFSLNVAPWLTIIVGGVLSGILSRAANDVGLYGVLVGDRTWLINVNQAVYVGGMVAVAWRLADRAGIARTLGLFAVMYCFELLFDLVPNGTDVLVPAFVGAVQMVAEWSIVAVVMLTLRDKLMFVVAAATGAAIVVMMVMLNYGGLGGGYVASAVAYAATYLCIAYGFLRRHPEWKGTNWIFPSTPSPPAPSG